MDLAKILTIAASGMRVQDARMRVVAQNLANANTLPDDPSKAPYRRRVVTFKTELDRKAGVQTVAVNRVRFDSSAFGRRYDPGNPGADAQGYVRTPNVHPMIEMMDMRSAERSYEANLSVIQVSKAMVQNALDLLRN